MECHSIVEYRSGGAYSFLLNGFDLTHGDLLGHIDFHNDIEFFAFRSNADFFFGAG